MITTRETQVTVPDLPQPHGPNPREALTRLLSSTEAQRQAAEVLRAAGFTVHAPGEVVWAHDPTGEFSNDDSILAIVGDRICARVESAGSTGECNADWGQPGFLNVYDTEAEARAAVERALKGGE